jgi:hypothetical protein
MTCPTTFSRGGLINLKVVQCLSRVFSNKNLIPHRAMVLGCD